MVATAEKPKAEEKKPPTPEETAADQLAARIRAMDSTNNVSGKDVLGWSDEQRKDVAKLMEKPPKFPWEVHEKYQAAVAALGKTKAERMASIAIAKKVEVFERLESDLDQAIRDKLDALEEMEEKKREASEANKAYAEAKEIYESASLRVIAVAENKKNRQIPLPMEIPKKASANGKAASNGKVAKPGDDPAEKTLISGLNLSGRVSKALDGAGIANVRQLITAMNKNKEWWWKDIKGLGETGFDELQLMMADFWKANPDLEG